MMDDQSPAFVAVDSDRCPGCIDGVFSEIESDNDDPDQLLDHFLDKSRSAKEISCRPCYHGRLETPIISFNVAALQLSSDLLGKVKHIPPNIVFKDKCSPQDFYDLLGCTRESKEVLKNILVFKFTPEDIEDEAPTEILYSHLVEHKNFAFSRLHCDLISRLFALPLPKENEPPTFLPITSRLNLEPCPREDNVLLGVLVKKPQLEEGELSGESNQLLKDNSSDPSVIFSPGSPDLSDVPPSTSLPSTSINRNPSPATLERARSGLEASFKLMPVDRYGSYIGAPTEDIPFLTDPVTCLHKPIPTKSRTTSSATTSTSFVKESPLSNFLESISSDSEGEFDSSISKTIVNRKRNLAETSQMAPKIDKPVTQSKQKRPASSSSSSMPNLFTPSPSSTTSTTSAKTSTSSSATTSKHHKHKTSSNLEISKSGKGGGGGGGGGGDVSPKKQKTSNQKTVDPESSESDVDQDLFPRQLNHKMTGVLQAPIGDVQFKYRVIRCDRPEVKKYLVPTLLVKARVNAAECERCLGIAKQKPNLKLILFQIHPRETPEDKRIFENYVAYLVNRSRYGLVKYHPETYRVYLLPYVRGQKESIGFETLKLKISRASECELYGVVIKKSALVPISLSEPTAPGKDRRAIESSEFPNPKYKNVYVPENFPDLDVNRLANLIHSSVDDLISLSFNMSNILQKATENITEEKKIEATNEFTSKVHFIMSQEEQQHAKRKKAYETVLTWLKTLGAS